MNRFDFLKVDYADLYKLCSEAETQQNMNKARQAIESIVRQFGANKRHLFDRIAEASERAHMPKNIIAAFHQVRLVGNKASHDETLAWNKITDEDIEKCINALFEIVVWLAIDHDKKIYRSTDFKVEDLKIVDKYLSDDVKSKRDKLKEIGTFINSLELNYDELNFDNAGEGELSQDVFETSEEYAKRIDKLPLRHIGYAILDSRTRDEYTGLTFAMFHIEHEDNIQFSDIDAFVAESSVIGEDFVDGRIVVALKVFNGKVYCDYDRIYLQGQADNEIKLTAICWKKHGYEDDKALKRRLKVLPMLPLGAAKPIRREYDLNKKIMPFKTALYKYVQALVSVDRVFVTADRKLAEEFCSCQGYFLLYGRKVPQILRHVDYKGDIKIKSFS